MFIALAYCASVALNVFCTAMISTRIWAVSRRLKNTSQLRSKLSRPIRIIVDSVIVYTVLSIASMVAYLAGEQNLMFLLISYTEPVAGMSFCLVIIRVSLSRNEEQDVLDSSPH